MSHHRPPSRGPYLCSRINRCARARRVVVERVASPSTHEEAEFAVVTAELDGGRERRGGHREGGRRDDGSLRARRRSHARPGPGGRSVVAFARMTRDARRVARRARRRTARIICTHPSRASIARFRASPSSRARSFDPPRDRSNRLASEFHLHPTIARRVASRRDDASHLLDVFHGRHRLGGDGLLRDRGLGDDANAGEGGGKGRHDDDDDRFRSRK